MSQSAHWHALRFCRLQFNPWEGYRESDRNGIVVTVHCRQRKGHFVGEDGVKQDVWTDSVHCRQRIRHFFGDNVISEFHVSTDPKPWSSNRGNWEHRTHIVVPDLNQDRPTGFFGILCLTIRTLSKLRAAKGEHAVFINDWVAGICRKCNSVSERAAGLRVLWQGFLGRRCQIKPGMTEGRRAWRKESLAWPMSGMTKIVDDGRGYLGS